MKSYSRPLKSISHQTWGGQNAGRAEAGYFFEKKSGKLVRVG